MILQRTVRCVSPLAKVARGPAWWRGCNTFLTSEHSRLTVVEEPRPFDGVEISVSGECNDLAHSIVSFEQELDQKIADYVRTGRKGVWLRLDEGAGFLSSTARRKGFAYHHCKDDYIMMTKWLPEDTPDKIPKYGSHQVGVGGFVLDQNTNKILLVKENNPNNVNNWKLPGGLADAGEEFGDAAAREVFEETGIKSSFQSILSLRHQHGLSFGKSDIYVICHLDAETVDISIDQDEIADATWMPLEEFASSTKHPMNKRVAAMFLPHGIAGQEEVAVPLLETEMAFLPNRPPFKFYQAFSTGRKIRNSGGVATEVGTANVGPPKQAALQSEAKPVVKNLNSRTSSTTRTALGTARFDQLPVCQPIKDAVANVLGYEVMTECQELSIPVSLEGGDALVKAKTGTGKTLGFLIPAIHRVWETTSPRERKGKTSVIVISPTRELACQIEEEAKQLLTYLKLSLQSCYGGTNVKTDLRRFRNLNFPDILVATPGRLNDHLQNNGLANALRGGGLKCLIFDEADQLLEMGFRNDITKMLKLLPPKTDRQTLLFSATMPKNIMNMSELALRPDFQHVDCVGEEDQATHKRVPQFATVYNFDEQFVQLAHAIEEGKKIPGYKIIVFFVTARLTQLNAELFNLMGENVLEIHSRKSQSARTKISKKFRNGENMIMFTSDVTARGMDYPDVSMVIQVGIPSDKAQYIHRLGRTGRAGKGGCGILLLADFERRFLNECRDEPLKMRPPVAGPAMDAVKSNLARALYKLPAKTSSMAYQTWLGYYNGNVKRLKWDKKDLVEHANIFAKGCLMLPDSPAIFASTAGKMGLKGIPGLNVDGKGGTKNGKKKIKKRGRW